VGVQVIEGVVAAMPLLLVVEEVIKAEVLLEEEEADFLGGAVEVGGCQWPIKILIISKKLVSLYLS